MERKRGHVLYTTEQKQDVIARIMPLQNESVAKLHEGTDNYRGNVV